MLKKFFLPLVLFFLLVACGGDETQEINLPANSDLILMEPGDVILIEVTEYGYEKDLRLKLEEDGSFSVVDGPTPKFSNDLRIDGTSPVSAVLVWDGTFLLAIVRAETGYEVGTFNAPATIFPAD